jgi:hypothetical protein
MDSNTLLNLLVKAAQKQPDHLAAVLCMIYPAALNVLFETIANGVLDTLVKAAQNGHPEYLASVLGRLNSVGLNKVLKRNSNTILNLLVKAAQDRHPEYLAWVISKFDPSNLNAMLRVDTNTILNLLVEKWAPQHLAWVIERLNPADLSAILQTKILNSEHLGPALICFKSDVLNTLLTTTENGILNLLVKEAQDGNPEHLAWVLEKLDPTDLNAVLQAKVNGMQMNEHAKAIRDKLKDDQDYNIKAKFTKILRKGNLRVNFQKRKN